MRSSSRQLVPETPCCSPVMSNPGVWPMSPPSRRSRAEVTESTSPSRFGARHRHGNHDFPFRWGRYSPIGVIGPWHEAPARHSTSPTMGVSLLPSWGAILLSVATPMASTMPSALSSSKSISLGVFQGRRPEVEVGCPPLRAVRFGEVCHFASPHDCEIIVEALRLGRTSLEPRQTGKSLARNFPGSARATPTASISQYPGGRHGTHRLHPANGVRMPVEMRDVLPRRW